MKKKLTWGVWAVLYALCVLLGILGRPGGFGNILYTVTALIFFLPGALLLYWGERKPVRLVSSISLTLTLALLIANFCSVLLPERTGDLLHVVLTLVSAPMICSGHWILSLFLWGCLLMGSLLKTRK